jgi:hypothetical protein
MNRPRGVRSMWRTARTRRVRKERGRASGIAASVLGQRIKYVGISKELVLAGAGRNQLLQFVREVAYAGMMTRNRSRRKSRDGLSVAVGERIVREVRRHVSREVKSATKRMIKAIKANSRDLEALWRALASEEK